MRLYHYNKCLNVSRIKKQVLRAECIEISSGQERSAWIVTDVQGLRIEDAGWADYRSPDGIEIRQDIPELVGMEVYINSGSMLKKALTDMMEPQVYELITECFRGIIMSETYFYRERGFNIADTYLAYWNKMNANGCRRFSRDPDKIDDERWMNYVRKTNRSHNLFNRVHNVTFHEVDEENHLIMASFIDTYHELGVRMMLSSDGTVKTANGVFKRTPFNLCRENKCHINKLIGVCLFGKSKKDLAALTGGPEGCTHMVDLLYDVCQGLNSIKNQLGQQSHTDA